MPSIVRKGPAFTSSGIVLVGEDVSEQGNGLVSASLNYVIDPSMDGRFDFSLDAPPPIYPRGLARGRLQKASLFMVSRDITFENGLHYVNAIYAGALSVPARDRFITNEHETLVFSFTESVQDVTDTEVFDTYTIAYRRRIVSLQVATLDQALEQGYSTPEAINLIRSARYISRRLAPNVFQRTYFVSAVARDELLKRVSFVTNIEESTDFITPTVKVYTVSFVPEPVPR
jgi:hypothetical protein